MSELYLADLSIVKGKPYEIISGFITTSASLISYLFSLFCLKRFVSLLSSNFQNLFKYNFVNELINLLNLVLKNKLEDNCHICKPDKIKNLNKSNSDNQMWVYYILFFYIKIDYYIKIDLFSKSPLYYGLVFHRFKYFADVITFFSYVVQFS